MTGQTSHTGHHVYRCAPPGRDSGYQGHVSRQAEQVEDFIERIVIARLSAPDAADLVAVPNGGPDMAGLREEAAAIRANLEEMARDRALGLMTRAQMVAGTEAANIRLAEIGQELEEAARENVLTPLVAAENAAGVWESLDLSRKRAIIKTLMSITVLSPGKGARRAFDPATVQITWHQQDAQEAAA